MADDDQDLELLRAWNAGSQAAGDTLYRRLDTTLRRFFDSKAPRQDIDELMQQTWLAMARRQRRSVSAAKQTVGEDVRSVRAYVLGIARHVVFAYYRGMGDKIDFDPEVDTIADVAPSVTQQLSLRRDIKRVELAMQSLPLDFQMVAEAFFFEEFTGPELAEMFDLPETTIRSRIRRAKAVIDELVRRWDARTDGPPNN